MTEKEARQKLEDAAWRPVGDKPLGEGGGGIVFRCISLNAYHRTRHLGDATKVGVSDNIPTEFLEMIAKAIEGDGFYGAGKVAKQPDGRLKREIAMMAAVRHPHLVRLLDHDKSAVPSWYVMELFSGQLELDVFKGRFVDVFRGLLQITDAVATLHAAKCLHRDIKPKNVYLRRNGEWVLGDLGIALADDGEDLTKGETSPASRDWIPPWRILPGQDHPPTWDLYMLAGMALSLCLGWKLKQQLWLDDPDVNLVDHYPEQQGIDEVWRFVREHLVPYENQFPSRDVIAFRRRVVEVLDALTGRRATSLLFSWRSEGKAEVRSTGTIFRDVAVYCSHQVSVLRASIEASLGTDTQHFTWYLEVPDGPGWKIAGEPESAAIHDARGLGWSPRPLIARLRRPLPAGWNRLRLVLKGGSGSIRSYVIYGE